MADESGQDRVFRIPHIFQNILMHLEITDWESCENVCQQWRDFVLGLYSKASLRYMLLRKDILSWENTTSKNIKRKYHSRPYSQGILSLEIL